MVDDEQVAQRFADTAAVVARFGIIDGLPIGRRRDAMAMRYQDECIGLWREQQRLEAKLDAGYDWLDANDGADDAETRYEKWSSWLYRYEAIASALRIAQSRSAFCLSGQTLDASPNASVS